MTFNGKTNADAKTVSHIHESPKVMLVPLYILAAGAIFAGWFFEAYFIGHDEALFWGKALFRAPENEILHHMHDVPPLVKWSAFIAMVSGFAFSFLFYIRDTSIPRRLAAMHEPAYKFLLNKWYFDELYDFIFVRPAMWLGRLLWKQGDGYVIDGFGPDGVAASVTGVTAQVVRLQTGYVYHYAFAMLIGVAAVITWFSFGGVH
jgi:NADH-quinone oxidoreductase subunit L